VPAGRATTRREALTRGVRAGLAGLAGAALLGPESALAASTSSTATTTTAQPPENESDRVYRLLSVELLLLFAYQQVLSSTLIDARTARGLAPLRAQEEAHVRALRTHLEALGGVAPRPPASTAEADRDLAHRQVTERLGQLRGGEDAVRLLLSVERVTIGAYFVALIKLDDPVLIRLAAEIMANDAQHEAMLGEILSPGDTGAAVPYGLVQGLQ
jgi:hypothetical protein